MNNTANKEGAIVAALLPRSCDKCRPKDENGAGYVDYLQSPREDEWVLLHEQQTWGAWRNDATGHSWD